MATPDNADLPIQILFPCREPVDQVSDSLGAASARKLHSNQTLLKQRRAACAAGTKASITQRRQPDPEGGREISAGGAASYMNPDEGEEDVSSGASHGAELGAAAGAAAGTAGGLQGRTADTAAQSGSDVDAGRGGVLSGRAGGAAAGAGVGTAADADPQRLGIGAGSGGGDRSSVMQTGGDAADDLDASAAGEGSVGAASLVSQGAVSRARGDDRAAFKAGSGVEPALGMVRGQASDAADPQLGAERRELLPVDRASIGSDAGTDATQRDPLLGYDPATEPGGGMSTALGGKGAASAIEESVALGAAAKGSVDHRAGTEGYAGAGAAEGAQGSESTDGKLSGSAATEEETARRSETRSSIEATAGTAGVSWL